MEKQNRKKFHMILPICMAVIIIVMDILFIVIPDRTSSETENRNLEQLPSITWNTVTNGRFESLFDTYVADQFPFRDSMINIKTFVSRLAGKRESNGIFLCGDGYLIQQFSAPSDSEYEEILRSFSDITSGHSDLNIYALIAPTKVSVLKDKLPLNAVNIAGDEDAFMDSLLKDLNYLGIITIDVRDTLSELEKEGTAAYYRTDHHWTTDAAFAAYNDFSQAAATFGNAKYDRLLVSDSFRGTLSASSGFLTNETDRIYVYLSEYDDPEADPGISLDSAFYTVTNVDTGEKTASLYDVSFLQTRDKYALFLGGNHGELKIRTTSSSERDIIVIKDSYANCFIPFLIPDFRSITVIDPRYYPGDLNSLISDENFTDILFIYNAGSL